MELDQKVLGPLPRLPMDEDCLSLNIWTPSPDGAGRPVLFYLHGRGYSSGGGSEDWYEGSDLARSGDVVVVTINHRLNVFGYLYLAEIGGAEFAGSGIAGLLDAVLALEWVRDNIAEFGGDPGNVTIFGESGGGAKVSTLLAMPAAKGLFQRAVIQSGPRVRAVEPAEATDFAQRLLAHLGIATSDPKKLQDIDHAQLIAAVRSLPPAEGGADASRTLAPVMDGLYLPQHPFEPAAAPTSSEIPVLIGCNRYEAALFMADESPRPPLEEAQLRELLLPVLGERLDEILSVYRTARPEATRWDLLNGICSEGTRLGSILLADRKIAGGTAPVYMYLMTWETDFFDGQLRSCHALDVPFVFNHPDVSPFTGGRPDRAELASSMSQAWAAFARTGDPNHAGIPLWPPYTTQERSTMLFDVPCRVEDDPGRAERLVWNGQIPWTAFAAAQRPVR